MIFCLGCAVIVPVFIIFNLQILPFLLIFPCVIFLQLLFTIGVSLVLACCNVFFRDTTHILEVLLMFWFWVTPVFYSPEMVPVRFRWVSQINPMNAYITMSRNILFEAKLPDMHTVWCAVIMALLSLCAGYALFVKYDESFLKRV
jgi:ABC-type polysaccharide/polyol phosphate export permease